MSHIVSVEGIECFAFHGCLPEEAIIGCKYGVDVHVCCDVSTSFRTDNLNDTVDYVMINQVVKEQMAIRSNLIEHVAARILTSLKEKIPDFEEIEVSVTKYNPPVNGNILKTTFRVIHKKMK
jgi:7,8-dihydroneopterin aldolase/epimerase/oxygenase